MPTNFDDLPPEVLNHVFSHIETCRSLCNFSLTCKKVQDQVAKDGFRIFTQARFPSYPTSASNESWSDAEKTSYWRNTAHALTTLSLNWDRRAFFAQAFSQPTYPALRFRHGGTQSMDYVPVIDTYQSWNGFTRDPTEDVVTWSEGTRLTVQSRYSGKDEASLKDPEDNGVRYVSFKPFGLVEGKDDIVSLHLKSQHTEHLREFIIGRGNGKLNRVALGEKSSHERAVSYETQSQSIRSTTFDRASDLLVACLSDTNVSVYDTKTDDAIVKPFSTTNMQAAGKHCRTWTSRFLSKQRVAIGLGHNEEPIQIFDLSHKELDVPFRKINVSSANKNFTSATVYALEPLCGSYMSHDGPGDIFLSGATDGSIRLHDLRDRSGHVSYFSDPIDVGSSIYSLLSFGREKFVAGGSRHSMIKVFDLRMTGERRYFATRLLPCSGDGQDIQTVGTKADEKSQALPHGSCCRLHSSAAQYSTRNFNTFLTSKDNRTNSHRAQSSPVYSLSRGSPLSPTFFAGIEGQVLQIDLLALLDKDPDPYHLITLAKTERVTPSSSSTTTTPTIHDLNQQHRHDPLLRWAHIQYDTVSRLTMYEHGMFPWVVRGRRSGPRRQSNNLILREQIPMHEMMNPIRDARRGGSGSNSSRNSNSNIRRRSGSKANVWHAKDSEERDEGDDEEEAWEDMGIGERIQDERWRHR